ncbi:MAG: hypothetical protein H8E30_15190 [Alphaproteobacteria bacterium]|nr:hypothetical protein [Alphaproteobacteria bacterium]
MVLDRTADRVYVDALVDEIRLLNEAQMRELFPDATIVRERFLIFTKSLIAVRAPAQQVAAGNIVSQTT